MKSVIKIWERSTRSARKRKIQVVQRTKNGFWCIRKTFPFINSNDRSYEAAVRKAKALKQTLLSA